MRRLLPRFVLAAALIAIVSTYSPQSAWARLSGLDNIPTCDTLPPNSYLLQAWSFLGRERPTEYALGLRIGLVPQMEATVDNGRLAPSPAGDTLLGVKYRFSPDGQPLSYAVGDGGIGAGHDSPFVVVTNQFKGFRAHVGYQIPEGNHGGFAGADRWLSDSFLLRGDVVQINDGHDLLSSLGFVALGKGNSIVEGWVQISSRAGSKPAFVLDWNYLFQGKGNQAR